MPYPLTHAIIPLGGPGLALTINGGVAGITDDGFPLDSAAGITDAQAEALIADARRWVLIGPDVAGEWFVDALRRARAVGLQLLAAE